MSTLENYMNKTQIDQTVLYFKTEEWGSHRKLTWDFKSITTKTSFPILCEGFYLLVGFVYKG